MFRIAQEAAESQAALLRTGSDTDYSSAIIPVQALPDRYSLSQLYSCLVIPSEDNHTRTLVILEQCLQHPDRIDSETTDLEYTQKLLAWLSMLIKPSGDILIRDYDQGDEEKADSHILLKRLILTSRIAFRCIRCLQAQFIPRGEQVDPDVLLSVIAYTDKEDPWTQEDVQEAVEQFLGHHQKQLTSHEFIIENVLADFIRPLFSDSQSTLVTARGRKAVYQTVEKPIHLRDLDVSKKPWKFKEVSAMTTLRWAIRNMDDSMLHKNWHLCIPPLLTLLDDPSTSVRVRGLHILREILDRIPSKVLQKTGLSEVFEDAVMPTLLFLPNLTPVEESLRLLTHAYLALLSLGNVRYPTREERNNKLKFLDRIMRQGVLPGFIHSGENVRIAELLLKEVITLFDSMGIHAVKYLKDIIPILSKILTDPFGPSHPSLLLVAIKATQTTIANCWPRMTESIHRIELVKALTLCWSAINIDMRYSKEQNNLELEKIKEQLQVAGTALFSAVTGKLDMLEELQMLVRTDPSLKLLFGIDITLGKKTL